jgi:hypothetical protein
MRSNLVKTFARIALLILFVFLFALPVLAQEAEATPVVIINDVPVAAPDGVPNIDVDIVTPPEYGVDNDTLLIVAVLVVGFIGLGVVIARGGNPDAAATNQLQAWQMNRDFMAAQERAYQNASAERKAFIDALASITAAFAPLTTFMTSDNALARYLRDVQTPGPETPPSA